MTELYKPETFEPLTETPWNDARVADAIHSAVAVLHEILQEDDVANALIAPKGLRVLHAPRIEALTVRAHRFSKQAEEKIRAAGGSTEVL